MKHFCKISRLKIATFIIFYTLFSLPSVQAQTLEELERQLESMQACQDSTTNAKCDLEILAPQLKTNIIQLESMQACEKSLESKKCDLDVLPANIKSNFLRLKEINQRLSINEQNLDKPLLLNQSEEEIYDKNINSKITKISVRRIQSRLNELGFDAGPADGIYGIKTKTAVENFYKSRGLKFDGILDENETTDITFAKVNMDTFFSPISTTLGFSLISQDGMYLGCWGCLKLSRNSICNEFGRHGSSFSSNSVWNEFGRYGSEFSNLSPWNQFSSSAPKLFDSEKKFKGRFSINANSGFEESNKLLRVYESNNGDLQAVRKVVCK